MSEFAKKNPMLKRIFFIFLLLVLGIIQHCLAQQTNPVKPAKPIDDDIIFIKVDKPAEFPGGHLGWGDYLQANLRYPNKAMRKNIQGMIKVQFLVDKDGNVKEVVAINNLGGGLEEEAVRIIKNGPKWIPAEQNGKKVLYRHIQAITFQLTD